MLARVIRFSVLSRKGCMQACSLVFQCPRQFYRRALDAYEAADALCPRQATLRSQILKTTGLMRKFGPRPGEGPKGADDDEDDEGEEGEEEGGEAEG